MPPRTASTSYDALASGSGLPRSEARALLARASGRSREWLIAHGDEAPPELVAFEFDALAARRRRGEPLAYLIGTREFYGRDFEVSPDVLIPREDTELIVELALARATRGARVLDLGTGSGCIALTLACERPDLHVVAVDRSPAAIGIAAGNARRLCPAALAAGALELRMGDWWAAAGSSERFDLVLCNPPYIAADDVHLGQGDLPHEPRDALTDGADGLQALARVAAGAPAHIAAGGWLLLEHGWDQGAAVRGLVTAAGLREVHTIRDAGHRERCSLGRMPVSAGG